MRVVYALYFEVMIARQGPASVPPEVPGRRLSDAWVSVTPMEQTMI